ncbi:ATP-binding protein [Blautia hansenii]|uniref:HAMP domain-containing sensor histidine kinase n=1 Tax=Blautia hansenii TaxID=1322 RepID=UPI0039841BC4
MDWIDVKLENLKKRIQEMSLFRGVLCYFLLYGGAAFVFTVLTVRICDRRLLMWHTGRIELEHWQVILWGIGSRFSGFFYLAAAVILMLKQFYKNRLKRPFALLEKGVLEIQKQNLQFSLEYESQDEMGQLLKSMDKMRETLVENYEYMWKLIEEQKQLNAAFAHDLRTPLTVLKGYCEFLSRYLPQGAVSQEKMTDILLLMTNQLERLSDFSKTMKEVRNLDEYPIEKEKTELFHFCRTIEGIVEALNMGGAVTLSVKCLSEEMEKQTVFFDENIVLEVLDNLLSNAIRFAKSQVIVSVEIEEKAAGKYMYLYVEDDGKGFLDSELHKAIAPYYSSQQEEEHFGIGLYICNMLCNLHGGTVSLANRIEGNGAIISASFLIS